MAIPYASLMLVEEFFWRNCMSDIVATLIDHKRIFNDILELDILDDKKCTITVCTASVKKTEAKPHFERLKIDQEMAKKFRATIKALQGCYLQEEWKKENLLFPEYARESDPAEYEIEHMNLSSYIVLMEQLAPLSSLLDIDIFSEKNKTSTDLRFYVITVQPEDVDPIYFFRKYTAKKELGRSRWLAWLKDGEYNCITEPLLLFDNEIDCMSRSGIMFIMNKRDFQHTFNFFETIKVAAQEALSTIREHIPIQNFEDFANDCERHPIKMRKLKNITTKSDFSKITMDHIKMVIEKQHLPLQIVEKNGKEVLIYDSKKPWIILNLLDDNYLWSLMTEQGYEVTGKRTL